ncbi:RNA polymerase sigma factor [Nibricoccus sp. IMCC34717]|uniref:RNA polymerase sigma factor n=1 Tax=Nibricoccus sp. IMCC34717 TaxID=3034021 RepID=UPI00384C9AF3
MTSDQAEKDLADIQALQAGDDSALDRLMTRWQIPLRSFLFRLTQNEFDSHDLAQETFVRVYRNRDRFRQSARFSTWLFAIASNLARDRQRRLQVRNAVALDDAPELENPTHPRGTSEAEERIAAVRDAIATLPPDLRTALVLFEYEDRSHAEIAEITESSTKAVETRLYRARQQLRRALARWLSDSPAVPRAKE